MDLVIQMPEIQKLGETILGGFFKMIHGDKGANQAVSAASLGAKNFMIGCVGNDSFGESLITGLIKEGIDVSHILVLPKESTDVALIQVDSHEQNIISVTSGANFCLTCIDVEKSLKSISRFDVLVIALETPLVTIFAAAKIASKIGAKVIFNAAPAQAIPSDLILMIDV